MGSRVEIRPAVKGDISDLSRLLAAAGGELARPVPESFGAALRSPVDESEEVADPEDALTDPDRSLYGIAKSYYGTGSDWRAILDANPGFEPTKSQPGDRILIPRIEPGSP